MTRSILSLIAPALAAAGLCAGSPAPDPDRLELPGDVQPLLAAARPTGAPDPAAAMARMILALRMAPGAQERLDRLLAELAEPGSPSYRRWLTPEEFGARFGRSREDLDRVTAWLQGEGFTVDSVSPGRLAVTFSGSVAQVERAFRTTIRTFEIEGRTRQGNATPPSIPAALGGLVAGVVSLHNLPRRPMNAGFVSEAAAPVQHRLTPGDFAAIYGVAPLYRDGIDGTGTSIAIVGRTRIPLRDVAAFRKAFGLPVKDPEIIVNGPDPGDLGGAEDGEADLDVEWSGAVARNATIRFVASASTASTDGIDLSAQFIVDHNLAPVMSTSFGQCEPRMGSAEQVFYKHLWAQAAAQGITSLVASGDSGPAGCDSGMESSGSGRAVSGVASTPYNMAVGGTQFDEGTGCYWKDRENPDGSSAFRHIPEQAWNESGSAPGGSGLWATGGGTSTLYPKPGWQAAPGVPANAPQYQYRCLPDLALAAAARHDGYLIETGGSWQITGGTSCSTPAMAGIMALVVQKTGQRQGNPCPALYRLGSAQYRGAGPAVFHDVTAGSTCVPGTQGYDCRPGYDLATGLGSVDAEALAGAWTAGLGGNVDARIVVPEADRTVLSGAAVAFRASTSSSDPGASLSCTWDFGDGDSAQGADCVHVYQNPGQFPIADLVTCTAADSAGAQGTDVRTITVLPPPAPGELIVDGGFELGSRAWTGHGVSVGDNSPAAPPHQGTRDAWFPPDRQDSAVLQQTVAIPPRTAQAQLTFWLAIDSRETSGKVLDTFQVKARGADGKLRVLGTWSNLDGGFGYQQYGVNLGACIGQTVQLSFVASNFRGGKGTGFVLDDVSLVAK